MLEYKRSLKARKLKADELPESIKSKISKLANIERNIIDAEKDQNDELVNELDDQFANLDAEIADLIDDVEINKPDPKPSGNDDSPAPKSNSNSGLIVGVLGLIGAGIAWFVVKGKK